MAVLGAGLAGSSVALELAARGVPVTLVERDVRPFGRASLRNEGKIHLGLIYANDASLATARLQLRGALRFGALMRRWLGPAAGAPPLSAPFHYIVARDSLLGADALEAHYDAVQRLYDEARAADAAIDYLGEVPDRLARRVDLAGLAAHLKVGRFAAAFETAERAIDTAALAARVCAALQTHPRITLLTGHRVGSVEPAARGYRIAGDGAAGPWHLDARQVVNCLWEERLRVDRSVGLEPEPGWLHRLKYRVIARLPAALRGGPSITMVLGPYGDVVVRADDTADTLAARVLEQEHRVYPQAVRWFAEGRLTIRDGRVNLQDDPASQSVLATGT